MTEFSLDLYLYYEPGEEWLYVPPRTSDLVWPSHLALETLLSCELGLQPRVDGQYRLGEGIDGFDFEELVWALDGSVAEGPSRPFKLRVGGEVSLTGTNRGARGLELTRAFGGDNPGYLERVALSTGGFYSISIDLEAWHFAVSEALGGLARVMAASTDLELGEQEGVLKRLSSYL